MKKSFVILITLIALLAAFYGESREFYCVGNNCVTVWKTFGNKCYIVPGKYFGVFRPGTNYIQTTNTNNLTLYFTSQRPGQLFVKSESNASICNDPERPSAIVEYKNEMYDTLFYQQDAKKHNDINDFSSLIDLMIGDNYALDKKGRKL